MFSFKKMTFPNFHGLLWSFYEPQKQPLNIAVKMNQNQSIFTVLIKEGKNSKMCVCHL